MTKLHSIMKVNKAMLVSLLFSLIIANISNAQNSTVFVEQQFIWEEILHYGK